MTAMQTVRQFVIDVAAELGFRVGHRRPALARIAVDRVQPGTLRF